MKKFKSILVVDNDSMSNYMARNFFKKTRACEEVNFCKNGMEALRFLQSKPLPELILINLLLPVMNGFEFMECLDKRGYSGLKKQVIFLTNFLEEDFPEDKYSVIDKPLTYEKFCIAISKHQN